MTITMIDTFDDFRTYSILAAYVSDQHPTLSVPTANDAYFYAMRDDNGAITGGYGLNGYGDNRMIIGLFSTAKGKGSELIRHAIARGGNTLECFDGKLREIYEAHGFKVSERYPFDPAQAPDNWDTEKLGTPDYLVMTLA